MKSNFITRKQSVVLGARRVSGDVFRVYLVEGKLSWYHQHLRMLLCTFWDRPVLLVCPCIDMDPQLSLLLVFMLRKVCFPSSLIWDELDLRRTMAIMGVTFVFSDMPLEMIILSLAP